ncbi:Uncharacterised protein [Vibrio cholerae]|uniref:Uncharacterized protein n=1 Tax=Vibrio cholerae TaxID=666 RepID=A0A656ACI1_VIBCL|nr:Uncharacterised protein [Vibrio cholerae]CSB10280.1 Uncharacterised protein [Vibrio cholerae]CSB88809.1 Uncharacterised protein [Vibrio cholerae]CSD07009.1 Uncharacterised protein [Vibrio cholerae]CSD16434.1 Uncharacterised protein [Vibrio cholerae]
MRVRELGARGLVSVSCAQFKTFDFHIPYVTDQVTVTSTNMVINLGFKQGEVGTHKVIAISFIKAHTTLSV